MKEFEIEDLYDSIYDKEYESLHGEIVVAGVKIRPSSMLKILEEDTYKESLTKFIDRFGT